MKYYEILGWHEIEWWCSGKMVLKNVLLRLKRVRHCWKESQGFLKKAGILWIKLLWIVWPPKSNMFTIFWFSKCQAKTHHGSKFQGYQRTTTHGSLKIFGCRVQGPLEIDAAVNHCPWIIHFQCPMVRLPIDLITTTGLTRLRSRLRIWHLRRWGLFKVLPEVHGLVWFRWQRRLW